MPCAPSKLLPCGGTGGSGGGGGGGGTGGGVYLGQIDIATLNTKCKPTPAPNANDYYQLTDSGTACGVTYNAGDRAVWSGTAWILQAGPSGGLSGIKTTSTINVPRIASPTVSWTSAAITVTGARTGDWVIVSANKSTQGIVFVGNVTSPDKVAITGINCTGGAITLGSTTFNITVISPT